MATRHTYNMDGVIFLYHPGYPWTLGTMDKAARQKLMDNIRIQMVAATRERVDALVGEASTGIRNSY